jgi:hypothetical protein
LRPAAGLLLGVRIGRDDFFSTPLCMIDFENRKKTGARRIMQKRAAIAARVLKNKLNDECYVSR